MPPDKSNSVFLDPNDCNLVNPVGLSNDSVFAAVRAGISNLSESSVYNKQFESMKLALVPDQVLPPPAEIVTSMTSRQIRMLQLAAAAISGLFVNGSLPPLPIFIAGPEGLYVQESSAIIDRKFIEVLNVMVDGALDMERVAIVPRGRAAGLYALSEAITHMRKAGVNNLLLVGVDSYLDLRLLASLDQDDRVMATGVMDGFFPGEGAAALLLTLEPKSGSIQIHLPGLADEPGHRFSDEPYRGDGLSQALQSALGNAQLHDINSIWCSMNGENMGAKEWGVSYTRNYSKFAEGFSIHHPAEYFGDIGAAFAPTLLALASTSLSKGIETGPTVVWCSSEKAERAAVVINKVI